MKKWLIRCLTVLAMVCLIPGIVLKAAAETTTVRCKNCGSTETREILGYRKYDSNSHRVYVTECQNCHNDGNVSYLKVHTGGTETPTCTKGKTCEKCGAEYGEKDPNNHDLVHHDAKAPSCTEIGWNAYEACSRCNYTTTYQELPALNHDLEQHAAKAPTCTEIGWDAYETCSRCDYTPRKELPALNHALEQHAAKAPTCTEPGWDAYETCSRCDYTTRKELPALNHDLKQYAAKAPTCTEIGWNAYETCSRCDHTTYTELPALNHDYQAVTVAPPVKQTAILFLPTAAAKTATPQTRPISWGTSSVHGPRTEPALRAPVVCGRAARTLAARIAGSLLSALRKAKR